METLPPPSASIPLDTRAASTAVRSIFSMDTLIYGFGSWSFGYWIALSLQLGWYFALGFSVAVGAVALWLSGRWRPISSDTSREWSDPLPLTVVLVAVLVWPIALEHGRSTLLGIALGLIVIRVIAPVVAKKSSESDLRFVALAAIAIATAVAYWISWSVLVAALCVIALSAAARPRWLAWFTGSSRSPRTDPVFRMFGFSLRVDPTIIGYLVLTALGLLIAVWWTSNNFWSSDNTYYLNKAAHYAQHGSSFRIRDYMYGFNDAQHYPFGDIFSTFEPLLGTLSALSSASPETLLFRIAAPFAMFLVPFSARYGARGLGLRRANLVGAVAAATVLLMTGLWTATLYATASYGKTIGALVMVPLLVGAIAMLLRHRSREAAVRATLAAACTVAVSPSLVLAAFVIVVPFTVAGLWNARPRARAQIRERLPEMLSVSAPLVFVGLYGIIVRVAQDHAGSSQLIGGFLAKGPQQAWERGTGTAATHVLTDLFVLGSIALLPLVVRSLLVKRATGLLILLFFGVLFSPLWFGSIVSRLPDLHYFAWRIPWALPAALLIGIALASVDERQTFGIISLVAALILMGLSGPDLSKSFLPVTADVRHSPTWPWQRGIPENLQQSAEALKRVTPAGGRFLAPPRVEEVSTALLVDRFPVYARLVYVTAVGSASHVPAQFFPRDRILLARGMAGDAKKVRADTWRNVLERVDVATVCIDPNTVPALRQAVQETYVSRGTAGNLCELWTSDSTSG
jgi:uncharacterized membrane protein YiaA